MEKVELDAVLALIKNDKGEVLAQLRNDPRFPHSHNKWELPGGKIEPGETYEEAMIREAKEETGLEVAIHSEYPQTFVEAEKNNENTNYHTTLHYYFCNIIGGKLYDSPQDPKVFEARFFSPEELEQLDWGSENDKKLAIEFSKQ